MTIDAKRMARALEMGGFVRGVAGRYGRMNDAYWDAAAGDLLAEYDRLTELDEAERQAKAERWHAIRAAADMEGDRIREALGLPEHVEVIHGPGIHPPRKCPMEGCVLPRGHGGEHDSRERWPKWLRDQLYGLEVIVDPAAPPDVVTMESPAYGTCLHCGDPIYRDTPNRCPDVTD